MAFKKPTELPRGLSFQVGGLEAPTDTTDEVTEPNQTRRLQAFTRATLNYSVVICVKSTTEIGRVTNGQKTQSGGHHSLTNVICLFMEFFCPK